MGVNFVESQGDGRRALPKTATVLGFLGIWDPARKSVVVLVQKSMVSAVKLRSKVADTRCSYWPICRRSANVTTCRINRPTRCSATAIFTTHLKDCRLAE